MRSKTAIQQTHKTKKSCKQTIKKRKRKRKDHNRRRKKKTLSSRRLWLP